MMLRGYNGTMSERATWRRVERRAAAIVSSGLNPCLIPSSLHSGLRLSGVNSISKSAGQPFADYCHSQR